MPFEEVRGNLKSIRTKSKEFLLYPYEQGEDLIYTITKVMLDAVVLGFMMVIEVYCRLLAL